jgi:hypothetical protein
LPLGLRQVVSPPREWGRFSKPYRNISQHKTIMGLFIIFLSQRIL